MAKYDVGRYQEACQKVRDVAREIEGGFPPRFHESLKGLVGRAVQGTLEACQEIYEPKKDMPNPGSDTDYETDKEGLQRLIKLFE